ncbi:unnamed protein product [Musa hybrid cultivar]
MRERERETERGTSWIQIGSIGELHRLLRGGKGGEGLGVASPGGHHGLELIEADEAVAVEVDAVDHAAALGDGGALADPAEDAGDLVGGDGAAAVEVEDGEGEAEVLLDGRRGAGVEFDELGEGDEPVAVGVGLAHHAAELLLGGPLAAEALEDIGELRRRDLAVAVGVELVEHPLEVSGVAGGGDGGVAGLRLRSVPAEEGPDLAHGVGSRSRSRARAIES